MQKEWSFQQSKAMSRDPLIDSTRIVQSQPLFLRPSIQRKDSQTQDEDLQIIEADLNYLGSQQRRINLQDNIIPEEEYEVEQVADAGGISKSHSQQAKPDIMEKFMKIKQEIEDQGKDSSIQSKTSTMSTTRDTLAVIRQIYDNNNLITPLVRNAYIHILVALITIISVIVNVQSIQDSLVQQTNQIIQLRNPQNTNYFYGKALFCQYNKYQIDSGIFETSAHIDQRVNDELTKTQNYLKEVILNQQIQIAAKAESLNLTRIIAIFYDDQSNQSYEEIGFIQFYNIYYERLQFLYVQNIDPLTVNVYDKIQGDSFMRANLVQFMQFNELMIIEILNETIDQQNLITSQFLRNMLIQLSLIIVLLIGQFKFWMETDIIKKKILILVSRISEKQAQEQIARLSVMRDSIIDLSSTQWRLMNYREMMFDQVKSKRNKMESSPQSHPQSALNKIKDANNTHQAATRINAALHSRIYNTQFFTLRHSLITLSVIIVWTTFYATGYVYHMQRNNAFKPSLEMTLKMVQFKHSLDSAILLGELIKSEIWLGNNSFQNINQSETILQFANYSSKLVGFTQNLLDQILQSKELDESFRSQFANIFTQDLCDYYASLLPYCNPSSITLQHKSDDTYRQLIENGVVGMIATLDQLIKEEFDYEMVNLEYIKNDEQGSTIAFLNSKEHRQQFVYYYLDTGNVMRELIILFQSSNKYLNISIADTIQDDMYYYYFILGYRYFQNAFIIYFSLTAMHLCLVYIWITRQQSTIISLRQMLVLIPIEAIMTTQFKVQVIDINQSLY